MKVSSIFVALFLFFSTFQTINAAELRVTSGDTAGPGTLRDIIEVQANDGDTIRYDLTVDGTSLEGVIKITKENLRIIGNESPETTFITKPNGVFFDNSGGLLFGIDGGGNGLRLENLVFENLSNHIPLVFHGAGIVGLHSDGNIDISLGPIENVSFADNTVAVSNGLIGAGIIGTMSKTGLSEDGTSATETSLAGFSGDGFTTNLGAEFSRRIVRRGYEFVPRVSLSWVHECGDAGFESVAVYKLLPSQKFTMRSVKDDRDRFELGSDVKFRLGKRLSTMLAYGYAVSSHMDSHAVSAGAEWRF